MMDDGRENVDESVAEEETTEGVVAATDLDVDLEGIEIPKVDPVLVDLEEFKRRAKAATTVDERLKFARAFSLPTLGCEVMVAPSQGCDFFEKMFTNPEKFFGRGGTPEMPDMDMVVLKQFVVSCVVQPGLDAEALDLLVEANSIEFSALAAFCLSISAKEPLERMVDRLGMIDTEACQLLFADAVGSLS